MEIKTVSLDDMLSPEDLARVSAKRKKTASHDLSDLIPKRPPEIEILEAVQVIFFSQVNTCLNCKREVEFPSGLVAMHKMKRHGRSSPDLAGIALTSGNQHPHLERIHEVSRSTSIVCASCVDDARFVSRPSFEPPVPIPGTPYWSEQFGWGSAPEIHKREEEWNRRQERLARELSEGETRIVPEEITSLAQNLSFDETPEYTSKDDTQ